MLSKDIIDNGNLQRISLKDAEKAQLMQRVDSKYLIPLAVSKELLNRITQSYYIVDNNGQTIPEYISDYYDTPDFTMYLDHQNRRPKRYKIRIRRYCATGDSFLEIKIKIPSGKTVKKRIPATDENLNESSIAEFVASKSPYALDQLVKTLETQFNRLTLVAKDYNERVTFDFNLKLSIPKSERHELHDDICVLEVKRSKLKSNSDIAIILREMGIRPKGFSKYSIGCALLYPNIKNNNFKQTILYLKKIKDEHAQYNNAIG
ncbi:MAG: polyphosphate polymerase domain-containing protein [Bacteroidales bacterium]